MRVLLLFPAVCLLTFSCEKEIPLDQEEIEPRIVVNGLFVAGDTIRIHLSESRDVLYEGTLPDLTAATAKLYDGNNNWLGDFEHLEDGFYRLNNYVPVSGSNYKITVSNAGFKDVSAQTNTPSIISVSAVDTLRKGDFMSYEIKFNDDPSQTNYYAVTIEKISMMMDDLTGEVYIYQDSYFSTTEIFTQNGDENTDGTKWGTIFLFSDATFNGGVCSFSAQNTVSIFEDSVLTVIGLRSLSEDFYKYNISLDKYNQTDGDPFAQPVQVYSNVENGLGIFGAYSAFTDTLVIQ